MTKPYAELRLGVSVPVMILSTSTNGISVVNPSSAAKLPSAAWSTSSGRRCPHATANYKKRPAEITYWYQWLICASDLGESATSFRLGRRKFGRIYQCLCCHSY